MSSHGTTPESPAPVESLRRMLNDLHKQRQNTWNQYVELGLRSYCFLHSRRKLTPESRMLLRRAFKVSRDEPYPNYSELWLFQRCDTAECKADAYVKKSKADKAASWVGTYETLVKKLEGRMERLAAIVDELVNHERDMLKKGNFDVNAAREQAYEHALQDWEAAVHNLVVEGRKRRTGQHPNDAGLFRLSG